MLAQHMAAQVPGREHHRDDLPVPPLTRVPEGLQGVQVVLCGSLVVPELAAGIHQVTKALPLRPPVP